MLITRQRHISYWVAIIIPFRFHVTSFINYIISYPAYWFTIFRSPRRAFYNQRRELGHGRKPHFVMLTWQTNMYPRGNAQRTCNFVSHDCYLGSPHCLDDGSSNLTAIRMSASDGGTTPTWHPSTTQCQSYATLARTSGLLGTYPSTHIGVVVVKTNDTMQCYRNLKSDQTRNHPPLAEQLPRPKPTIL
jgi:hypothetical protein